MEKPVGADSLNILVRHASWHAVVSLSEDSFVFDEEGTNLSSGSVNPALSQFFCKLEICLIQRLSFSHPEILSRIKKKRYLWSASQIVTQTPTVKLRSDLDYSESVLLDLCHRLGNVSEAMVAALEDYNLCLVSKVVTSDVKRENLVALVEKDQAKSFFLERPDVLPEGLKLVERSVGEIPALIVREVDVWPYLTREKRVGDDQRVDEDRIETGDLGELVDEKSAEGRSYQEN